MRHQWLVAMIAALACALVPASALADATLDGSPLNVYLGNTGGMQATFDDTTVANGQGFWYGTDNGPASSGFFIRFHADSEGLPGTTYVSAVGTPFTLVEMGTPTGAGTAADPLRVTGTFKVVGDNAEAQPVDWLEVKQTARYVNGDAKYRMTYEVKNVSDKTLRFRAATGGDLYVDGDDAGVGVLIDSSPRFVGGTNNGSSVTGGAEEVFSSLLPGETSPTAIPAWAGYELSYYGTIWGRFTEVDGMTDFIEANNVDNGVGVEWEDHLGPDAGLAPGQTARYEVLWRMRQPLPLTLTPPVAAPEVGTQHTVLATLRNSEDEPQNNVPLRWEITGANPATGSVQSEGLGQALIQWTGTVAGEDTLTVYADFNGNSVRDPNEPSKTASAKWRPESDVDPAGVGSVPLPGGGNVDITSYPSDDDPTQQTFQIGRSQTSVFPECPGRPDSRQMDLPMSVPMSPGSGTVVPGSVRLLLVDPTANDPTDPIETLNATGNDGNTFQFLITCVFRVNLYVEYTLDEEGTQETFIVPIGGLVLIDPQGVVYDRVNYDAARANGASEEAARAQAAITGATARLQRQVGGVWRNVLSGDPGIAPNVNPQVTGANGLYQWDVAAGTYRVVVSAPGYVSVDSRAVVIPPPVLDLHIPMERVATGGGGTDTGTTGGGTDTTTTTPAPVTTNTPAPSGVRPATVAPLVRLAFPKAMKKVVAKKGVFRFVLQGTKGAKGKVSFKTAGKKPLKLGTKAFKIGSNGKATIKVTLSKKAKAQLRKLRRLKVLATATAPGVRAKKLTFTLSGS